MIATTLPPRTVGSPPSSKIGRHRRVVCALLFFATTINYLDRMVFGLVGPVLQKLYGWSSKDYTDIVFWFEVAYAIGLVSAGRFLDWIGTRKGFSVSVVFWSLSCMLHALMSSITGFSIARFLLGLGEAGNFPACVSKPSPNGFQKRSAPLQPAL
jgi:ACS family hexuronate transporter-like MFS transporter